MKIRSPEKAVCPIVETVALNLKLDGRVWGLGSLEV